MPRTAAVASWVSPSSRRLRRRADRMQACASPARPIGRSCGSELNSRAPTAAPERAAFDRYPWVRIPLKVAIYAYLRRLICENDNITFNTVGIYRKTLMPLAKLSDISEIANILVRYQHNLTPS
jgi:hypothetical protein